MVNNGESEWLLVAQWLRSFVPKLVQKMACLWLGWPTKARLSPATLCLLRMVATLEFLDFAPSCPGGKKEHWSFARCI